MPRPQAADPTPPRFEPRAERLADALGDLPLHEALSRLRGRSRPVLLDSAGGDPRRFGVLAWDPLPPEPPGSLVELRDFVGRLELAPGAAFPPDFPPFFHGGFLGALAYDLGAVEEPDLALPAEPWGMPLLVGGLYTDFLVRDEVEATTWLVLGEAPGDGRSPRATRRAEILDALSGPAPAAPFLPEGPLVRCVPSEEHRARIERARDFIAEGEIYQANIAHRFVREVSGHPVDLYLRLRELHPAPYLGYLGWEEGALLSGSPELLLECGEDERGRFARTRPIKGTSHRGATPEEDRASAARLLTSEKDLAELAMIVDLERNDLGKIAEPGGVSVQTFPRLESYATVHHLVADLEARVRDDCDAVDVLSSLFPGGSITGAPKLRSMEVIAELEQEGRGFSFGSLGFLDLRGRALFNLLIRTQLWRPRPDRGDDRGEVAFRVGGGITWASDAEAEDEEAWIKGKALARALDAPAP